MADAGARVVGLCLDMQADITETTILRPHGASGGKLMAQPGDSLVYTVLNRVPNLMHSGPMGA